ncbi:unnamed protein product [Fraxinus pennsylvanica]|uniref:DUF4283 domain-containing protein n=1 Tax=Fraxinus pennsylvanica TaxID=56036 RepID=A0AAD1ZIB5_9LAMI|nr:unnamed protein product [Fraxinus pennsylvanica]
MQALWGKNGMIKIRFTDRDNFFCEFESEADRSKVIRGEPWSFERRLIVLQEIDEKSAPNAHPSHSAFWIQVHNLPFIFMNREIAEVIGSQLGIYVEVDTDLSGSCWGSYMRIRVKLDVSKPLVATMDLQLGSMGGTVEVEFKYERLPEYCTLCGYLDHGLKHCNLEVPPVLRRQENHPFGHRVRAANGQWRDNRREDGTGRNKANNSGSDNNIEESNDKVEESNSEEMPPAGGGEGQLNLVQREMMQTDLTQTPNSMKSLIVVGSKASVSTGNSVANSDTGFKVGKDPNLDEETNTIKPSWKVDKKQELAVGNSTGDHGLMAKDKAILEIGNRSPNMYKRKWKRNARRGPGSHSPSKSKSIPT